MARGKGSLNPYVRLGNFGVGAFAGLCAAVLPRLAAVIGASANNAPAVEMDAFRTSYILASVSFAFVIGFGAMIWEWNSRSSPRQTLVAALGLPALFAGALNSVAISSNATRLGEELQRITDKYAEDNGIQLQTSSMQLPSRDPNDSFWNRYIVVTAYAQDKLVEPQISKAALRESVDLGIYRQRIYWIVLDNNASTRQDAERKVKDLGLKYGKLAVQQVDRKFAVILENPLPYSQAVSRAVAVKRESRNTLSPSLVPAR